jgi:hypothetical protein
MDNMICQCRNARETGYHFLIVCQNHEKLRDKIRKEVGETGMKMEILLGDYRRIKHTVEFIEGTGRFDF